MSVEPTHVAAPVRPAAQSLREHLVRTMALAGPVVVSRSGMLVLIAVDTAMTGRAGATELAYLGIGFAPQVVLTVVSVGLLVGTAVLAAQADGAGNQRACGGIWRVSLLHGAVLGVITGFLCLLGEPFLLAIGQDPELARGGGDVLVMFSWAMPPMLLGIATSFFLEGISRPKPVMVTMLGANVINVGLNWILIYGNLGAPAMGAEGAALATAMVRALVGVVLIVYVLGMRDRAVYGVREPIIDFRGVGRRLRRIGYPLGVAYGLETAAMMTLVFLAGYLGTVALASYQVAHNLVALVFMVALGIGTATSVRVANAVGRHDRHGITLAGWTGIGLCAVAMMLISILFLSAPGALAAIYTEETEVLTLAAAVISVIGLLLVFDGVQGVAMGALRGTGDVWIPATLHLCSFWGVAVPAAALFAFRLDMGAPGLAMGLLVGLGVGSTMLCIRFAIVSKREVRPA
jgi:MATE family multidrug resistance protein